MQEFGRHGKVWKSRDQSCRTDSCTPDAPSPFRVNKKQNKGIPKDGLLSSYPADSSHHSLASMAVFIKETLGFMAEEVT